MVLWSWCRSMRAGIITQSGSSSCWRTIISSRMSWRTVGKVRTFPTVRQDILEEMIVLQQELDPDCVMMPALIDLHQDHKTIAEEGLRAFKRTTVLAYEIPWNNLNFAHQAYVRLEERH